jgi:hypothetical protein
LPALIKATFRNERGLFRLLDQIQWSNCLDKLQTPVETSSLSSMNIFQALNLSIFVGTLSALVGGLSKIPGTIGNWSLTLWLFVALFLFLRLKMVLDDHAYFSQAKTKNINFKVGFLTAIVSWLFWALGAYSVSQLQQAYFTVGLAISISTLWILAVALLQGATRQQYAWLAVNTFLVALLWATYRRDSPNGDWPTWCFLGGAILLVLLDFVFSKSIPELDQ